jgi:DNA-binding NtrC family response regulator
LRDRREDIPLLANYFLERFGKPAWSISKPALDRMMAHDWPGNVRELENAIERAVILSEGSPIEPESLPAAVTGHAAAPLGALPPNAPPTLETIEKAYILYVLEQTGGVKTAAAELLGIDPSTLHRKIDRYGLRINAAQERAEA